MTRLQGEERSLEAAIDPSSAHLDGELVDCIARRYGCQLVEGRSELLTFPDQYV